MTTSINNNMSDAASSIKAPQKTSLATLKGLLPFLAPYRRQFIIAAIALVIAAGLRKVINKIGDEVVLHVQLR